MSYPTSPFVVISSTFIIILLCPTFVNTLSEFC
nr:MAG TPA: hypothetical protein [Caudoviricetes sp.]